MLKTHSWRTASLVMALTAIVGLALPAHGDDKRLFSGYYAHEGTEPGSGQATPLGPFTQVGDVEVEPDGSAAGTEVFTVANGDQLFIDVKGFKTKQCGLETPEVIPLCGTFTVAGGTGQFIDASGKAQFAGVIMLVQSGPPQIAVAFVGTIKY